jgi:glyoxalase family protein
MPPLEGLHHITCITGDAPANVEFYAGVLGLRLVKKTVNQDDPTVYHLFYGDDDGSPGLDLTFFEYPGATRGRAGAGMVHRIVWRVRSTDTLAWWHERLRDADVDVDQPADVLRFRDFEGLEHELRPYDGPDRPLTAAAPDVPEEHRLQGFDGVRAYALPGADSARLLTEGMAFTERDGLWWLEGDERRGWYAYDEPPAQRGLQGAGTVHHVAWGCRLGDQDAWRERVAGAGARPTPVIDRFYFRSVYFREPNGILFELATWGPGFAIDEDGAALGHRLSLPPDYERLRPQLEPLLTPLPDPWRERTSRSEPQRVD